MREYTRGIWTYYLFKATTSYGFIVPFSVVYLRHQGYGLDVIGYAQAAFLFAIVAMEIPAGYVADRIGRRASLATGNACTVVVMGGYPFVESVGGWIALYVLWGVAWSFHSAIGDAWLYDFLERSDDSSAFASASGRAESVERAVSAVAAITAGALYAINPDFPFFANAALAVTGVPLVLSLPAARDGLRSDTVVSVREVLRALRLQLSRSEVRWLVLYSALFNVLFSATRWLEQPALEAVGFPLAGFGVLYASFTLLTAGAMLTTGWIQERLGPRLFFLSLVPVCGLAYGMVALLPVLVVPVIYLRRVLDRISSPIRNQYLNDRLDDVGRATVLSGASMVLSLASGLFNAILGRVAEATGPTTFLPIAGLVVVLVAGLLWAGTSPVRPATKLSATGTRRGTRSD